MMIRSAVVLLGAILAIADAGAEPIIILVSLHNLDYAQSACSYAIDVAQKIAPADEETAAAVVDCKLAGDTRALGRRLEYEVESRFAVTTRCKGVTVLRTNHPEFDGKYDYDVLNIFNSQSKPHWNLLLDYHPGSKVHGWSLHRGDAPMKMVEGEGTPAQIADEACIAVTGQGGNVR